MSNAKTASATRFSVRSDWVFCDFYFLRRINIWFKNVFRAYSSAVLLRYSCVYQASHQGCDKGDKQGSQKDGDVGIKALICSYKASGASACDVKHEMSSNH